MAPELWLQRLQNALDPIPSTKMLAGVLGDAPSRYAKSPELWNAAFTALGIEALYVPFDVRPDDLAPFLQSLRQEPRLLGFSVTVPYKEAIFGLLDQVDERAQALGAVNTVVKVGGHLRGHNTDGQGALDALMQRRPGESEPFFPDLSGRRVLLIGGGGAAKAVGHALSTVLQDGELCIANRSLPRAEALAEDVRVLGTKARAIRLAEVADAGPSADLIVNTSTLGQSGLRLTGKASATCLEPYSCLAPAHPTELPAPAPDHQAEFYQRWYQASWADIAQNQAASLRAFARVPRRCPCFDLVYSPSETTFLAHARLSGHRTMNGKAMLVYQAARALVSLVCSAWLAERGLDPEATYRTVADTMFKAW